MQQLFTKYIVLPMVTTCTPLLIAHVEPQNFHFSSIQLSNDICTAALALNYWYCNSNGLSVMMDSFKSIKAAHMPQFNLTFNCISYTMIATETFKWMACKIGHGQGYNLQVKKCSNIAISCYRISSMYHTHTTMQVMHLSMCTPTTFSRAAQGKTRGFDIPLIKCLYLRAEFLIKSPYFRDSTINITTDLWLSDHSQTCLEPIQVEGDHVKYSTLGEGPLIDPLVKAPHQPRRGTVGDLIDKCINFKSTGFTRLIITLRTSLVS